MTAIAAKRKRTTLIGFVGTIVLVVAAASMFVVGVVTLSNSEEGEAVGVDLRPMVALPATPNALLAVDRRRRRTRVAGRDDAASRRCRRQHRGRPAERRRDRGVRRRSGAR